MEATIERKRGLKIRITDDDGGCIESQSVEANLQFAILEKLESIRGWLESIESGVNPR